MKILNKIVALSVGTLLFAACTELDTEPAGATFTEEQKKDVASNIPERLAADISGMYSMMGEQWSVYGASSSRADDFGYPAVCLSADLNGADMVSTDDDYNWFSVASEYSDRTYTYANPYIRWALFYNQIKAANDVLAAIPDDTDESTLLYYKGQALACRAFDYLNLVTMYQFTYKGNEDKPSVPIVTNDIADPSNNPRATVQQVYDLIKSDIDQAIELLDGYTRPSVAFVDQRVAYGIRARVNLNLQNWAEAASDAEKAMSGFSLLTLSDVSVPAFNTATGAASSSWMWGILLSPTIITDAFECWPSKICSFNDGYTGGVGCYKMINKNLWKLIPSTDVRKGWWVDENLESALISNLSWPGYEGEPIGPLSTNSKAAFLPYTNVKFGPYQNNLGDAINASDWCIMRAEEMLLIRAEGLAMSGDVTGAKTLLEDFVKTYRNPEYTCKASTADAMQNEIWFQRRIELWGEGFAFSDFMRLKKNMVRFNSKGETNFPDAFNFNLASTDGWLLLRIPQKEVNANNGIAESDNNSDGTMPIPGDGAGLKDGITD